MAYTQPVACSKGPKGRAFCCNGSRLFLTINVLRSRLKYQKKKKKSKQTKKKKKKHLMALDFSMFQKRGRDLEGQRVNQFWQQLH